jgi:hypothetical protein
MTMVRVAFAARGRRLLRAAYILLDNGDSPESVPLLRTISEYVIVGRWLALDTEKHLRIWAYADVGKTLHIDAKAFEHGDFRLMEQEARERFEAAKAELRGEGEKPEPLPQIEQMAKLVDLSFAYNTAYRIDSQSAVHASGMAVNNAFEEVDEGYIVRPEPLVTLGRLENYGRGAAALADLLSDADNVIPELGWTKHLELVHRTLNDISKTGSSSGD